MKFTELPLIQELQESLKKKGYYEATPIQEQAIPALLAGKDVLGIAQTGTGKTAAYGLPILQHLANNPKHVKQYHTRTLILAPTRELAAQIDKTLQGYGRNIKFRHACIYGGVGQRPQENAMAKGVDILVATPGRLLDLYRQKYVFFKDIEYFVLDEADRMLDMGFLPDIKTIIKEIKDAKQRLLFSATMAKEIEKLAKDLLRDPLKIEIRPESKTVDKVKQHVLYVDTGNKNSLILELLQKEELDHVLVFTRTKRKADQLSKILKKKNIQVDSIHGDKSQTARTRALADFRRKKIRVLVATEIAARGLDVDDISHVINFDVPTETESYIHRIGRTARAGADGIAYLFCTAKERSLVKNIEKEISQKLIITKHPYYSEEAEHSKQTYKQRNNSKPKKTYQGRRQTRTKKFHRKGFNK